jgi:uncharacterized OB-fold protein
VTTMHASRDSVTGEVYVPARKYAADGSLRECEPIEIAAEGVLASWTCFRDEFYGLVDLAGDIRIQVLLGPGPHRIGQRYVGVADTGETATTRFVRG